MAKLNRFANIIDVETTCWEPPEYKLDDELSEVIEIGIAVVNIDSLEIIENDSVIIRPQRSKVSKFCTKLTTHTQEYVDTGISFQEAMIKMKNDYNSEQRVFISWGDFDRKMFENNCLDYGVKYPFGPRHMNLRNTFTMLHGLGSEPGLDEALEHIDMKMEGTHHLGICDAKNIANIFIHSLKQFRSFHEMKQELCWRHEQDIERLEHSKELEIQKLELLEKIKFKII